MGGLGFLAMGDGRACQGVGRPAPGEESWRLVGRERRSRFLEKLQGEGIRWATQVERLASSKCRSAACAGIEEKTGQTWVDVSLVFTVTFE